MDGWVHDHSTAAIPARPDGLAEIQATYGPVCGNDANAGRSYWPNHSPAAARGYVYYHAYIAQERRAATSATT